jgi:hypothetical protein
MMRLILVVVLAGTFSALFAALGYVLHCDTMPEQAFAAVPQNATADDDSEESIISDDEGEATPLSQISSDEIFGLHIFEWWGIGLALIVGIICAALGFIPLLHLKKEVKSSEGHRSAGEESRW